MNVSYIEENNKKPTINAASENYERYYIVDTKKSKKIEWMFIFLIFHIFREIYESSWYRYALCKD